MTGLFGRLFAAGLFTEPFMVHAWVAASAIAVVAALVGVFVNLRGAAFAAHAVPQAAFTGGAAAFLMGANSLLGLGAGAVAVALALALLRRPGPRGVLTALVLVAALGTGDLLLTLGNAYAPEVYGLLFGQLVGVDGAEAAQIVALSAVVTAAFVCSYRPLLFSTVSPGAALARGVPERGVEVAFMGMIAAAAALTVPAVGALLAFGLMVAPAAAARQVARTPAAMAALSVAISLAVVWIGLWAAYDSGLPAGFLVTGLGTLAYGGARLARAARRTSRPSGAAVTVIAGARP
jgi:zinc/manganese transport system permease protein